MSRGILRLRALVAIVLLSLGAAAFSYAAPGSQTLVDLIRSGQRAAALTEIASHHVNVNAAAPDGSTPLMWAVYTVDQQMVRALLKRGAKANVTNRYGATALTEAVKVGDVEFVRMLLRAGANANSPNQDGETALMLASSIGSLPIAKLLVRRGATVNAVESFRGQTALMWAAAENHPDVVELLLKHGANVKVRAKYNDWPRQMTSEPRAQFRQTGGLTALLYATRSGCYRCAVAIVKAGADVNQPNPDGVTPLINAIDNRSYDIAMFLLDRGANPGAWDMSGRTPLYVAVDLHSFNPRILFFGGLAFGARDAIAHHSNKATAMDLVNRLLALGVDPNHQLTRMRPNGNGRGRFEEYMLRGGTGPLMVAAMRYDVVALKALLAHGAEVNLPNVFRITPLMAACGMSGSGRGFLFGRGPGQRDIQARAIETIDLLMNAGANINARVTGSHTHTAQLVAYVRGRDHEGQTALFAAAESGWDRVVKDLLARGADPAVRDDDRKTALDYARHPPPAFPGRRAPRGRGHSQDAARAATVALLQAALTKRGFGADVARTK
ncbi:MAG: ankyrin repeat domain-containing protein [Steroidobacteraceae bacterium]